MLSTWGENERLAADAPLWLRWQLEGGGGPQQGEAEGMLPPAVRASQFTEMHCKGPAARRSTSTEYLGYKRAANCSRSFSDCSWQSVGLL